MKKRQFLVIALAFLSKDGFSQFVPVPLSANNSYRFATTSTVDRIGFGNSNAFANGTSLPAVLTINANGLTFPTDETFRTSSPGTANSAWRMFTGAGNGVQRASFYTQPNSNVFTQSYTGGNIYGIRTGSAAAFGLRMLVSGDVGIGAATGRIAMGDDLPENFLPQNRLHLHHSVQSNVLIYFTNVTTGAGAADGSTVGIVNGLGEFRINQYEDQKIRFFIADPGGGGPNSAMHIEPGGRTYVGRNVPGPLFNRFTIDADALDATRSGLNFTDLNSGSTYDTPTGNGMLSLNNLGDVIWVPSPTGIACWDLDGDGVQDPLENTNGDLFWDALDCQGAMGPAGPPGATGATGPPGIVLAENGASINALGRVVLGQRLGAAGNPGELFAEVPGAVFREVPMNGLSLLFTNNGNNNSLTNSKVGIGIANTPQGKLDLNVANTDNASTAFFLTQSYTAVGNSNGIFMRVNGLTTGTNYGERSFVSNGTLTNVNKELTATGGVLSQGISVRSEDGSNQSKGISVFAGRNIIGTFSTGRNVAYEGEAFDSDLANVGAFLTGGRAVGNGVGATSTGIFAQARGTGLDNYAGNFYASGGNNHSIGVQSIVNAIDGTSNSSIGLSTQVEGGIAVNYGVWARTGTTASANYAIYGEALPSTLSNRFAGYFEGNVHVTGQVTSTNGTIIISDQQFKTNVSDLTGALSVINQLQPKFYYYDTVNYSNFGFEVDQQMGLIAQQTAQVIPTIVSTHVQPAQFDSLGVEISPAVTYKGIEYDELIPLLISGVKEQQTQIQAQQTELAQKDSTIVALQSQLNDQNSRLTAIENCLSAMTPPCQMSQQNIQQNDPATQEKMLKTKEVLLSDKAIVILSQNAPNPFSESTLIQYTIPPTVKQAQIHFYNQIGVLLQTVELTDRGLGELKVFANDLSSGIYTYTLIADGKIVATEKMIKN